MTVVEVSRAMWITTGWNQKWVDSKKNKLWAKFFPLCQEKFSFLSTYFSTSVLEHFGLWKVGIIIVFGFILVYYYLTNSLKINQISFKKWIKIVYFLLISHNFVLISNKPVALSRCGRIFNQWLYVTCGRSVSETEFQWRNICKKRTSSRQFLLIWDNSLWFPWLTLASLV